MVTKQFSKSVLELHNIFFNCIIYVVWYDEQYSIKVIFQRTYFEIVLKTYNRLQFDAASLSVHEFFASSRPRMFGARLPPLQLLLGSMFNTVLFSKFYNPEVLFHNVPEKSNTAYMLKHLLVLNAHS